MRLVFSIKRGQLIFPPVRIQHQFDYKPMMVLDTGSRATVITPELATEIGIDLDALEFTSALHGVGGSGKAAKVILAKVSMADLAVENLEAMCYRLPAYFQLDGILGLNFLQHFNFTVNHDAQIVSIDKRSGINP